MKYEHLKLDENISHNTVLAAFQFKKNFSKGISEARFFKGYNKIPAPQAHASPFGRPHLRYGGLFCNVGCYIICSVYNVSDSSTTELQ